MVSKDIWIKEYNCFIIGNLLFDLLSTECWRTVVLITLLTLSHLLTHFDASAADNFWKQAISPYATMFSTLFDNKTLIYQAFSNFVYKFQSRLLQICCMWERVSRFLHTIYLQQMGFKASWQKYWKFLYMKMIE